MNLFFILIILRILYQPIILIILLNKRLVISLVILKNNIPFNDKEFILN